MVYEGLIIAVSRGQRKAEEEEGSGRNRGWMLGDVLSFREKEEETTERRRMRLCLRSERESSASMQANASKVETEGTWNE